MKCDLEGATRATLVLESRDRLIRHFTNVHLSRESKTQPSVKGLPYMFYLISLQVFSATKCNTQQ